ncbi:MAG: response regulator transcription factor [Anaerofustis sp.]
MRVLLVEDEVGISKPLCKILEKNNIPTDAVYDGVSALMQVEKNIYDVVILDIMLPEMDGLEVLRRMRQKNIATPVLLLTAKDSIDDKITGFEKGADDYVTKPFSSAELVARVKALSRRRPDLLNETDLCFGDITLNTNNATVKIGEKTESLTAKESHILEILIRNAGNIISKEYLLDAVWGFDSDAIENTVEIYIHYLRKKLERSRTVRIITQRGLGYILKEDANAE